jgi:hypothetical protein
VSVVTFVAAPQLWREWIDSLVSNLYEPQYYSVPPAAPIRLPIAAVIVIWGALTDRPWTVGVAATLGLPIIWPHGLVLALAAVPFLSMGDRAAANPGWEMAASLRRYLGYVGAALGIALAAAAVFSGPLSTLFNEASSRIDPYNRRP